ncbi:sigma 54-interacting transcriptional regulator [Mucilaginibacter aquaedulcis]|uniref:sigma 54-interacting transcriptional regulator n=1 Tax=Mucilaginibacter aquaedulcis TaxID=1187081 RepID=UPI0025B5815B|nr:sigma 54-interacting transcriptional regulator [Mucilaginibacter aquaedulcis]MDN3548618.1 sigma 54-interacting transcriptional regulator [Mucilaginibacter aquaedulcis]
MDRRILIVEDESLVAYDLKLILTRAGYKVCGIADSVEEALEIIEAKKPEMVLLDIFLKGPLNGIDLAKQLTVKNIAFVYLSANFQESILEKAKTTQPYGFLVKPFREKELLITLDVAYYRHQNSIESKLRQEQTLEEIFKNITANALPWRQKLLEIARSIQPYVPFDYLGIGVKQTPEGSYGGISFLRIGFDEYQVIGIDEFMNISRKNLADIKKMKQETNLGTQAQIFNNEDFIKIGQRFPIKKVVADIFQMRSFLHLPLLFAKDDTLTLSFYNHKADGYTNDHLQLLRRLQQSLLTVMDSIFPAVADITEPEITSIHLNDDVVSSKHKEINFNNIVGNSKQLLAVLDHIAIVAPLTTSVLILGESGTGKERIAKCIHNLSARKNKPLVVVNCASLPANLIESELFGHEKGAFTGAIERRIGKFEQANNGTIFLDEIGEMPPELQVKLLRVLQEQEIERLGGREPFKIDVRIIAATNRNLEKEVEEGRFRLDLYYRLFVFPIIIPPLRDRKDDIEALVSYFIELYSQKNGKLVTGVSDEVLDQLFEYHWPGNVRELEHFIERNILLCDGQVIKRVSLPQSKNITRDNGQAAFKLQTIDEHAREHILAVIKKCNGKISGKDGAAEKLGLPASTLHSKMQKLGIKLR